MFRVLELERDRERKGEREGGGETPMLDSKDLLAPFQVCEFAVLFEVVAIAAPSSIRPRTVVDRASLTRRVRWAPEREQGG